MFTFEEFTPLEYMYIAIANAQGLDKELWATRIQWAKDNLEACLKLDQNLVDSADEPMAFIKACHAMRNVLAGEPTGFIMGLDASNSGCQLLGTLIGCETTMRNTNVLNTGERRDFYGAIAKEITDLGFPVTRPELKQPVMTHFYNSKAEPKKVFGEGTEALEAFYAALRRGAKGAEEVMVDIQSCWQHTEAHSWRMPDGHVVVAPCLEEVAKKVEIDELDKATTTFIVEELKPSDYGVSLPANCIHSCDAWVLRYMKRKCHALDIPLLTIHDCIYSSPLYMNKVRRLYNEALAWLHENNFLQSILRDITGNKELVYVQYRNDLKEQILEANYSLC